MGEEGGGSSEAGAGASDSGSDAGNAGAVKKLRDDQKESRGRACVIVQALRDGAAADVDAEIDDAIKVLDDELHQAMHAEGDVAQHVGALKGSAAHDDLLLMLAMQVRNYGAIMAQFRAIL